MSECSICTIEIEENLDNIIECCQCKHKCHINCLKAWYEVCIKDRKEPSCPNCRHCHCHDSTKEECCSDFLLLFHQQRLREKMKNTKSQWAKRCNEVHIELIREIRESEADVSNENRLSRDPTMQGIVLILSAFLGISVGIGFLASQYDPDHDGYLDY